MTPFQIDIGPARAWRAAVLAVAVASLAALLAWLATAHVAQSPSIRLIGGIAAVAAVASAASLWRLAEGRLLFDGRNWARSGRSSGEPEAGQVRVTVDLGSFLLLRFEPGGRGHGVWMPVAASSAPHAWHALRAAVHSAARSE